MPKVPRFEALGLGPRKKRFKLSFRAFSKFCTRAPNHVVQLEFRLVRKGTTNLGFGGKKEMKKW